MSHSSIQLHFNVYEPYQALQCNFRSN